MPRPTFECLSVVVYVGICWYIDLLSLGILLVPGELGLRSRVYSTMLIEEVHLCVYIWRDCSRSIIDILVNYFTSLNYL